MSYTMDCYLGRFKQSPRFLLFSLYVSFFPQLIAGPIVRSRNFFTQWKKDLKFDYENAVEALYFIAFGLMLKIVLADNLAPYVDRYYNSPGRWNITVFIFATYCFAIQIYADFWGYTLMARGVAKLFAIELPINFQSPYQAHSIRDFWQRWHQSLSSWFRDYLYIPLGGSRLGQLRTQCNILIVFLISGAWHGANWTFILWGAFHGICLLIENQFLKDTRQQSNQFAKPFLLLKRLMTFHLVLIGWSIFRTNTVSDLVIHWEHLLNLSAISLDHLLSTHFISPLMLSFCILVIILALLIDFLNSKNISIRKCAKSIPYFFRWGIYAFILLIILALGEWREKAFIYFQF
jgi:D-alanyl-lipoteichoic acid acyltransferase DltB (MBOAT superfamily)